MHGPKMRQRLERYVVNYYDELRKQLTRHSSIREAFPAFLIGRKRVVAVHCTDGILVSHWSAEQDSFDFQAKQVTVREAASGIAGPSIVLEYPPGEPMNVDFAEVTVCEESGETHRVVYRSPWDKLEISRDFGPSRWGIDYARLRASNDVLTFVVAHLMLMRDAKDRDAVLAKLEGIIKQFEDLLRQTHSEEDLQAFLSEHPVLLYPTAVDVLPKHRLGSEYVTDFVIRRAEEDYILVEIEASSHSLFVKKGHPSAQLSRAQQQVEDWRRWIHDHIEYAREGLPGITDPDCWIIIGRHADLSGSDRVRLGRKNKELQHITIMTFDDLLKQAQRQLDTLRGLS